MNFSLTENEIKISSKILTKNYLNKLRSTTIKS